MQQSESPAVLVAGAINTDLVATVSQAPNAGETITGHDFRMFGGGKGANQAVAVSRSGGRVVMVGAVGDDEFGAARLADLRADNVATDWVQVLDDTSSGVALILVEDSGENRIAYIPGATLQVTSENLMAAYAATRPAVVLVPNEVEGAALETLLSVARADGALTILNATPEPLSARHLLAHVSILIVNEHESVQLLGHQVSGHSEAAGALGDRLGIPVLVTAGGEGVFLWDGRQVHQVRGPRRIVVDTTGAGDTFAGALVAKLAVGVSLLNAVEFGVHAAGLSVTRPGAQSSIPTLDEVARSLAGSRDL